MVRARRHGTSLGYPGPGALDVRRGAVPVAGIRDGSSDVRPSSRSIRAPRDADQGKDQPEPRRRSVIVRTDEAGHRLDTVCIDNDDAMVRRTDPGTPLCQEAAARSALWWVSAGPGSDFSEVSSWG